MLNRLKFVILKVIGFFKPLLRGMFIIWWVVLNVLLSPLHLLIWIFTGCNSFNYLVQELIDW